MELFGGFVVILWMAGFFLTVIWFILPFVIFSIKARVEEILHRLDQIDARLATLETRQVHSHPHDNRTE